jgi:predicted SnoaL-like aldol condensation-catalyzing enzyme
MKSMPIILLLGGLISANAMAAKPTDMDGAKTANGKVVVNFIETLFNQHKGEEAFDKYVSRNYLDHGYLGVGPGPAAAASEGMSAASPPPQNAQKSDFERGREGEARMVANSKIHIDIKKVIAQGDLVFVQGHGTNGQSPNGDLMWVLYRVENGKITEHWDTHNEIPNNQVDKQW